MEWKCEINWLCDLSTFNTDTLKPESKWAYQVKYPVSVWYPAQMVTTDWQKQNTSFHMTITWRTRVWWAQLELRGEITTFLFIFLSRLVWENVHLPGNQQQSSRGAERVLRPPQRRHRVSQVGGGPLRPPTRSKKNGVSMLMLASAVRPTRASVHPPDTNVWIKTHRSWTGTRKRMGLP